MKIFKKWASHEYSLTTRFLLLLPAGLLFAFFIPFCLIILLPPLDQSFHFPWLSFGIINIVLGGGLIILGIFYAWWSIEMQLFKAQGTPLPMMATQKLLISGAFKQCRNPMAFGTICAYLGISILIGSLSSILFVLLFTILLLIYIKFVEEHELALRFGEEYLTYKAATPFFFPRIFSRKNVKKQD